ncbi:MAG TPA: PIN domain-containing protein [Bryobacteraceae bacterium]|nr:PIN domain-containing protein [Bryobacteraceae bacterium]
MAKRIVYWDTSIFLCFLNKEETERSRICEDVLQHASMEEVLILTSTYTIVEVIRPKKKSLPGSTPLTPEQVQKIKGMFRWPFIQTIELDDRTANYASDLARDHGLAPADAVHAASAILWKAQCLHAWDRDFSRVSQIIAVEQPSSLSRQRLMEWSERASARRRMIFDW